MQQTEEELVDNSRRRMASMLTAFNAWEEATEAVNPVDLLPRYTPTKYREPPKSQNRRQPPPKQPWSPPAPRTEKFGPMPSNDLLDSTFFDKHAARFGGKDKIFLYHEHNTRVQKRKAEEIEEMMVQERKKVARYLGGRKSEGRMKRRMEAKREASGAHEMKVAEVLKICVEKGWVDNQVLE
ncbi:hypothetical protein N0V94_009021 [Neodidymelliopsis sp. IMI 364377]|nr:hypothetical protein N0V94_009021 [Neodidymelliopsis sp. IMI 364377]